MVENKTIGARVASVLNCTLLVIIALLCVLPVLNVLAISFSSSSAVSAGKVLFWPVDFTLNSYEFALTDPQFFRSLGISVLRALFGVGINMIMVVITAYPLAHDPRKLHGRNLYMGYFVLTMLIGGGLIPTYIVVSKAGLIDSIWSLILPTALPVYYMVIMMNFMRGLPKELEEAALIDGASPIQTLTHVILPCLKPALATIALFCLVNHWNDWFSGLIYMDSSKHYPLMTYLQTQIVKFDEVLMHSSGEYMELIVKMNTRTGRASQLFLASLPLLLIYPFLQKYFTKGLILGSVKE